MAEPFGQQATSGGQESALAILDLDQLAAGTLGDPQLEGELLDLFAGQCRALGPRIARAGDAAARADAAHALRGSAAALGAAALSGLCARIEAACLGGQAAPPELDQLADTIAATLAAVAARRGALTTTPLAKADGLA